ncbi:hypothetical protein BJY01DRAFT_251512 [Aspergillus pseudoustus]|uniref:Ankyrin repeat-containing domain protein n=1 Tax=Aspergillus pseudoustus TaxID=1810923 RepID=A0ABR4JE30_9EURO
MLLYGRYDPDSRPSPRVLDEETRGLVRSLLEEGVDPDYPNRRDSGAYNPLCYAAYNRDLATVTLLLEYDARALPDEVLICTEGTTFVRAVSSWQLSKATWISLNSGLEVSQRGA